MGGWGVDVDTKIQNIFNHQAWIFKKQNFGLDFFLSHNLGNQFPIFKSLLVGYKTFLYKVDCLQKYKG